MLPVSAPGSLTRPKAVCHRGEKLKTSPQTSDLLKCTYIQIAQYYIWIIMMLTDVTTYHINVNSTISEQPPDAPRQT